MSASPLEAAVLFYIGHPLVGQHRQMPPSARTWANCGPPVAMLGEPHRRRLATLADVSRYGLHSQFCSYIWSAAHAPGVESVALT
jgi:hypothetical protein